MVDVDANYLAEDAIPRLRQSGRSRVTRPSERWNWKNARFRPRPNDRVAVLGVAVLSAETTLLGWLLGGFTNEVGSTVGDEVVRC